MANQLLGDRDALRVTAWFLISCEIFVVASRLVIKKVVMGSHGWDDALAVLALTFSIVSGAASAFAASAGLGKRDFATLTNDQLELLQTRAYVSEIFHVLCEFTIRLSILLLVKRIYSRRLIPIYMNGFLGAVLLWGITSTIVVASQCRAPKVWDLAQGVCLNMAAFWRYFSAIEIIIDLAIILLPSTVSWQLQMPARQKAIVIVYFSPWLGAIAVAVTNLYFARGFRDFIGVDYKRICRDIWPWFICAQVLRATSILSACIPYLRQLIEAFPSGLLQPDEIRRRGLSYSDYLNGFSTGQSEKSGDTTYYIRESATSRRGSSVKYDPPMTDTSSPTISKRDTDSQ